MARPATILTASAALVALGSTGCGSSSSSAGAGSDFCTAGRNIQSSFNALGSFFTSTPSAAQAKSALQTATSAVDSFDSSAPSDISADTHTLRTALDSANSNAQSASDLPGIEAALSGLTSSNYNAAGNRVDAYVKSHCGFSIESGSTSSSAGGAGSSSSTDTGGSSTSTDTGSSSSSTDTGTSSSSS